MMTVRYFIIGLTVALLTGPVARSENVDETILLSAGNLTVTRHDLQQSLLLLTEAERTQTLAGPDALKKTLRQLYQSKRMAAEAERLGLDQTPKVQARLAALRRFALTEALREHASQQIEIPDFAALAREHYAAHRDEFQLPEQFKAAHILKKVRCDCERESQRRKIEQLRTRLQAGEDFATLAKAESDDTGSATRGGDLGGWVKRESFVAPFASAMAALEIGQVSDVVETQFGYHIIKLLDRQPARPQSFEEVQPNLEQRLRQSYTQDQLQQQALNFLPGTDAQFDEAALQGLLQDH